MLNSHVNYACLQKVLEAKDAHASKVGFWVVPLEAYILPLFGFSRQKRDARLKQAPKLEQHLLVLKVFRVESYRAEPLDFGHQKFVATQLA